MVVMINYDLIEAGKNYEGVAKAIKGCSINGTKWVKPLKSLWIIKTSLSVVDVYAIVKLQMDNDDLILVNEMIQNYQGFLPSNVIPVIAEFFAV